MTQQTAINWLKNKLKETYDKEGKLPLAYTLHLVEQAKQMEEGQIVDAFDSILFQFYLRLGIPYNDIFGGQGSPDTNTSQSS